MVSLLDFNNSISQTDDIQDVSAGTVAGEVDLLAPGRGGGSSDCSNPPGYGPAKCGRRVGGIVVRSERNIMDVVSVKTFFFSSEQE